jgi:ribonuclease BN (tRNA processing enzyme)
MKLVLLGTGGYYPTAERQTACLFLPEVGVVLDAGSGICRLNDYLQTDRLDIFLTHAHLDHVIGLTYMLTAVPQDVLHNTTVHGLADKLTAVRAHVFAPGVFPILPAFRAFEPLDDRIHVDLPNGGRLTHFPLEHPGGSTGFRLNWPGHSMAYVTDTTATPDSDYMDAIRGVDLLVHECYFAANYDDLPARTGHSWLDPVAQVAAAANVGRLVLVHIGPHYQNDAPFDLDASRKIFKNVEFGQDGLELQF